MREEISKILSMYEEGKLEKEEVIRLIEALQDKDQEDHLNQESQDSYSNRMLKVHVFNPDDGEDVKVNVPIKFLKAILKTGKGIVEVMPQSDKYQQSIDSDFLLEAIESEFVGNIVDITSEDGDRVLISIE